MFLVCCMETGGGRGGRGGGGREGLVGGAVFSLLDDELDSCAILADRIFCAAGRIFGRSCAREVEVEEVPICIGGDGCLGSA